MSRNIHVYCWFPGAGIWERVATFLVWINDGTWSDFWDELNSQPHKYAESLQKSRGHLGYVFRVAWGKPRKPPKEGQS